MPEPKLPPVPSGFFWRVKRVTGGDEWYYSDNMVVRLMETTTKRTFFGNPKTVFKTVADEKIDFDRFSALSAASKRQAIADRAQKIMDRLNGEAEAKNFFGDYPPKKL